ncbi:unnamed protein product, partial [Didymodactylos carnosus]
LVFRHNNLSHIPYQIGRLKNLKELHIQHNKLQILPPDLDLLGQKHIFRYDPNPFVPEINAQLKLGLTHLFDYLKSDDYYQ